MQKLTMGCFDFRCLAFVPSKKDAAWVLGGFSGHVTFQIWSRTLKMMAASNRRNMSKNQPEDTKGRGRYDG